jgi:hypothetical protein
MFMKRGPMTVIGGALAATDLIITNDSPRQFPDIRNDDDIGGFSPVAFFPVVLNK